MAVVQKSIYHKANKVKEEQASADPEWHGVAKTRGRGSRIRVWEKGKKRVKKHDWNNVLRKRIVK